MRVLPDAAALEQMPEDDFLLLPMDGAPGTFARTISPIQWPRSRPLPQCKCIATILNFGHNSSTILKVDGAQAPVHNLWRDLGEGSQRLSHALTRSGRADSRTIGTEE